MAIFKRGKNWYVRIRHGDDDVRRKIGPDRLVAEAAQKKLEKEYALAKAAGKQWTGLDEILNANQPKTFKEAVDDFLAERAHYKPSSLETWRSVFNRYLLPEFGSRALIDISEAHCMRYQAKLSAQVSPIRANNIFQPFRTIMSDAKRRRVIQYNPLDAVKPVQQKKAKIDPLSEEDLTLALSHVDPHYRAFFTVFAYTGARPNELQALRWSDIDWVHREISISKGRVRGKEGLPKTDSSERLIPMLEIVEHTLTEHKNARKTVSLKDYVFTRPNGEPIDKHTDRIWARALKAAGLRHRPSYQLRHTFATQLIIKGAPLGYVARILGHGTIEVLVRHYARWIDSASKEQDDRMRQLFGKVPQKENEWALKRAQGT